MELSSQRGGQQRKSSFSYQQLGYSQGPQGVCHKEKGKTLSESYLTLNNNNDILSDNNISSGEEHKEIEGGGRHFFQLLNKSKAGQLQNFPGHLSQGFEVDQGNEKLGPSTSEKIQSNAGGCQIGQANPDGVGLGQKPGQERNGKGEGRESLTDICSPPFDLPATSTPLNDTNINVSPASLPLSEKKPNRNIHEHLIDQQITFELKQKLRVMCETIEYSIATCFNTCMRPCSPFT